MSYDQAAADPLNHNKLLHAEIERLRALLESNAETALLALTDEQRMKVFGNFFAVLRRR